MGDPAEPGSSARRGRRLGLVPKPWHPAPREQTDDPAEAAVRSEAREFADILRLDSVDTYDDLSGKTLKLFGKLPDKFDADFYFKVRRTASA